MNTCYACHRDLDEAAIAARKCPHCGAAVRPIVKRTIEDRSSPVAMRSGDEESIEQTYDLGKASDSERKHPTLPDRSDMTVDYTVMPPGPSDVTQAAPESTDDSSDRPTRRSTHTLERDMTIDYDTSSADVAHLDSQWRGTIEKDAHTGRTIRQRETIGGHRSSLPVKSRFVRERKKNGSAPPATLAEVPDYELLEIIGEGGMGVVYAAHQSSIARTVAVKMLKPSAKVREEQRDKFISEAVVTGELDHPNIVPIYDLGANDQGALFYSMKRVKGTPWDKVLNHKQIDENLSILMRVADAVAFAHAGGVIHRDLKPENVMLGDYGEVLVMDWGLARITSAFANIGSVYQADNLGGTPAYMAPEMARGPVENISVTSDIYLLGAIMYEIIGGRPPHSGRDVMQCLMAASQNRIDPIRYDGELKNIALKAMSSEQKDRYQTVKEFQEAIRVYQSHSESLVLTAHANQNLQKAREANDYALFARALYGCQEALTLWSDNVRARGLLTETQRDYGRCAFEKGDLDLGASLLDATVPEQKELLTKIDAARAERDARARRLRRAKQAVVGLVAAVILIITVFSFWLNAQRNRAVTAEKEAVAQKDIAVVAEKEAVTQKDIADVQRTEAVQQRSIADQQRTEAVSQKQRAEQQTTIAVEQRGLAEQAKQAEEYESYVARIGLAAAKINDNAFDFATELLNQCKPEMRNWEWGRLAHLCNLSTRVYDAAGPVDAVAYSPDGKSVASADRSGKLTVRDVATGQVRYQIPHGQYVSSVAYSPDGRLLASGSSDRTIKIIDAATGGVLQTLGGDEGHTDGVLCVSFSRDGQRLASGSYDNTARIWDLASRKVLQVLRGHAWWVWSAEFSPDGNRLVTAGQDGKVIVWEKAGVIRDSQRNNPRRNETAAARRRSTLQVPQNTPTDEYVEFTVFTGHAGAVYAASFSPNGKQVATGGYDKLVTIWNPDEVEPIDIAAEIENGEEAQQKFAKLVGHDGPVRSIAFSPNGKLVASGSEDNSIRLWDVDSGESTKMLRGHGSAVRSAVFSPDGEWIVSGGQDSRLRVWNVQGYQEVRVLHTTVFSGHVDAVLSARFSKDGKEVVTASRDRTAMLWDATSGERLRRFEEGHDFLATSAVFFADGRRLATGAGDNSVRVWDVTSGTQSILCTPTGRIGAVAVAPGGDWLATGSPGTALRIWDVGTGEPLVTLPGHTAEVSAIAISPAGDLIASGDDHGRVRLWRHAAAAGTWEFVRELRGHTRSISAVRFLPDGRRIVTASGDHTCAQWDVATGEELRPLVLKHPDWVSWIDISADGTLAVTTCDDGKARLWRLADATELESITSPDKRPALPDELAAGRPPMLIAPFTSAALSPDGRRAVLVVSDANARTVRLWNLTTPGAAPRPSQPQVNAVMRSVPDRQTPAVTDSPDLLLDFKQIGGLVWSAMFSPDGRNILTVGGNDAQLWNLETRRSVVRLSPHGAVASADVSPDGRLVVTGSWDHSAKLWDAASGKPIRKLEGGHAGYINSVEFSADGRELLTASDDGTARLWNVESGKPLDVVYRGHAGRVFSATYSPDATRVLTASGDKTARIWNRLTAQADLTLSGHTWGVLCGRFSPDGQRVITGSEDNTARIWDVRTGAALRTLEGHTAAITSVAFSPDGTRVLTGSRDNSAKLWDASTGKEILSLPGHTQEVTSVNFSPDGRNVLTASRDGTAIVWLAENWKR